MNKVTEMSTGRKILTRLKKLDFLLVYAAMVVIVTILKPNYLSLMNVRSVIIQTSMLGIIASGMTLVLMTGGVDMSIGAVAGLAALGGLWGVVFDKMPLGLGLAIGFGLAIAIGLINGLCVSRLGIAPFVATLGTMFLAQGLQYLFSEGGQNISYGFPKAFLFLGSGKLFGVLPMPVVIYLLIFLILLILTEFSPVGRYMKGTGLNQFTSELSGVRTRDYTLLSYVLCAMLAATLGLVLCASQSFVSPKHGDSFMMDALLVVLLGKSMLNGKVTIYATAFGALFLRSFETALSMLGIPVTLVSVCKGGLLVIILLVSFYTQKRQKAAKKGEAA